MNNPFELPQLFTLGGVAVTSHFDSESVLVAGCTDGGGCHYGGGCSSGGALQE